MESRKKFLLKIIIVFILWVPTIIPTMIIKFAGGEYLYDNFDQINNKLATSLESNILFLGNYILVLTFLTIIGLLVTEFKFNHKIHPIQYLLILLSFLTGFLLIVAFSKYLIFNISYFISCLMVGSLLTYYTYFIIKKKSFIKIVVGYISSYYFFTFEMISHPENALLIGSLSFFAVLALIMYLTRNVDYYDYKKVNNDYSTMDNHLSDLD